MDYKKIIAFVVSMAMLLPIATTIGVETSNDNTIVANAETSSNNKCGDNATWSFDETTGTLTISGTGAMYDYDCSYFSSSWLSEACGNIMTDDGNAIDFTVKKLIVEDGITYIGNWAFASFNNLESVELPNTLTSIGEGAFHCYKYDDITLQSITIPKSVTSIGEKAIGYYNISYNDENGDVQYKDELLDSFTIKGYTGSQAETYAKENGITFVALDDNTTDITSNKCGDNATWSFDETTGTLTISGTGDTYDYTLDNASPFADYDSNMIIKKIIVEDGITSLGDYIFFVGSYSEFEPLYTVESISLPDTLISIGDYAIAGFTNNLKDINLPNNLEEIGEYAFIKWSDANAVNSILNFVVPKSVKTIGKNAIGYLSGDGGTEIVEENFTITGYAGSQAETYAKENGIQFIALDVPSSNATKLNNGDTITLTGTVKSESYEINSENQGTVLILELDTPVTYAFYGDTTGNYTDGQEVLVESVQLSDIDDSYIGKNITVEGEVLFAHTGLHIRDIVLQDCSVVKNNTPVSSNYADAYAQFLKAGDFSIIPNLQEDGTPKFSLIYIDKDDIPELVLTYDYNGNINNNAKSYVFTYYNDAISYVGEFVNMEYIEKQNYITSGTTNSGFGYTWIYSIENGVAVQKAYLYYNGNNNTYYIDDVQVTKDEYLEKIEMLNNSIYNFDRYDINDANIQEYIYNHHTTTTSTTITTTTDSNTTNDTTTIKDSKDSADTSDKGILPIVMATLLTGGVALATVKKKD